MLPRPAEVATFYGHPHAQLEAAVEAVLADGVFEALLEWGLSTSLDN